MHTQFQLKLAVILIFRMELPKFFFFLMMDNNSSGFFDPVMSKVIHIRVF